jgi:hypothetical protein
MADVKELDVDSVIQRLLSGTVLSQPAADRLRS